MRKEPAVEVAKVSGGDTGHFSMIYDEGFEFEVRSRNSFLVGRTADSLTTSHESENKSLYFEARSFSVPLHRYQAYMAVTEANELVE